MGETLGKFKKLRIAVGKAIIGKVEPACNHKWEHLSKEREEHLEHDGFEIDIVYRDKDYIYCPKCRTRRKVTPLEWSLLQKQYKIDQKYMKECGINEKAIN